MKILIAPDSFKGSITASEACNAIERGIKKVSGKINTVKIPMADGGEGTVESLVISTNGKIYYKKVTGPLGKKVKAFYGILGDKKTAVIEMAAASGLTLIPLIKRNPLFTTTYGTGELIKQAVDDGCKKIIIGIGGSATNDGGMGALQALGVNFFDINCNKLGYGGKELININKIDTTGIYKKLYDVELTITCDVTNTLFGPKGAAYIYAPQKGATKDIVKMLDSGLRNYSDKIKKFLNKDISLIPGSGAAGGLGAGLIAFFNAKLESGIKTVLEISGFEEKLKNTDLVITGEGKTDHQTLYGKAPAGIAKIAKKYNIPVICLSGSLDEDIEKLYDEGITAFFSITNGPMELQDAMQNCKTLLESASENIIRLKLITRNLR